MRLGADLALHVVPVAGVCSWTLDIDVRVVEGRLHWGGPAVHGRWDNRFLRIGWLEAEDSTASGVMRVAGHARLMLNDMGEARRAWAATLPSGRLGVQVRLTDVDGRRHRSRIPTADTRWCVVPDVPGDERLGCTPHCTDRVGGSAHGDGRWAPACDGDCHFMTYGS